MRAGGKAVNIGIIILLIIFTGVLLMSCAPAKKEVDLISLDVLFGNPSKVSPQLSPDGKLLTYVAPVEGVLNIWIKTVGAEDDKPLTHDKGRGIRRYGWTFAGNQLVYVQDKDGDENWKAFTVNVENGEVKELTPADPKVDHPVQAQLVQFSRNKPKEALIGLNKRDARIHDVYHINLETGKMKLVQKGDVYTAGWITDHDLNIRGYQKMEMTGGTSLYLRSGSKGKFKKVMEWGSEDAMTSGAFGFKEDNTTLYLMDSKDRNSTALFEYDTKTGDKKLIAEDSEYDVGGLELNPITYDVEAVSFTRARREWQVISDAVKEDFELIKSFNAGDFSVTDRTLDDKHWLLAYVADDGPVTYCAYDRENKTITKMFVHRPELEGMPLVHMKPISFQSRDGLTIHGYLTLPANWEGPGPMVLNVHGGPWFRDSWGYNPEAQWMANRGYAHLQVNFRGSTGYGKEFVNKGDREWGGNMQNDLTDAVAWAVEQGIADPAKVAIYGGSYGGYATLAGVTFTPDLYACGVSIVGPSNLETFLNTIPPYWESFRKIMDQRVGWIPRDQNGQPKDPKDYTDEEKAEVEFLHSRSPLFHVDNVKVPMLIGQGAMDPRVNKAESDQFVDAMKAKGLDVQYVVYDNEGHGFARPENRLDFYYHADKFFAKHLGGRCEEVTLESKEPEEIPTEGH